MLFIRQFGFGKLAGVIGCARIIISFFWTASFFLLGTPMSQPMIQPMGHPMGSPYGSTYGSNRILITPHRAWEACRMHKVALAEIYPFFWTSF